MDQVAAPLWTEKETERWHRYMSRTEKGPRETGLRASLKKEKSGVRDGGEKGEGGHGWGAEKKDGMIGRRGGVKQTGKYKNTKKEWSLLFIFPLFHWTSFVCFASFHWALLINAREGCHHFFMAAIIKWIRALSQTLASPTSSIRLASPSPLAHSPSCEVAVLPHCRSHHHQSANCWPWERTSLRLVIPLSASCILPFSSPPPALNHRLLSLSRRTFPRHLSSSLSSPLGAVSLLPSSRRAHLPPSLGLM